MIYLYKMVQSKLVKYALFGLFLIVSAVTIAQSKTVELNWFGKISEVIEGNSITTITFDGAENVSDFGLLPVYSHTLKQPSSGFNYDYYVTDVVFESLTLSDIEDFDLIPESLIYFTEIITIRQVDYSVFRLVPLIRNNESGTVEKVTSFTLKPVLTPSAVSSHKNYEQLFTESSVFASGKWHKMAVAHDGIYKVTYEFLNNLGVEVNGLQSDNIRLFGNGWGMLSELNADNRPDDLIENAIMVIDGNDGTFDPGDYFLFYGQSPDKWIYNAVKGVYEHIHHLYSDYNYYFITIGDEAGVRIEPYFQPPLQSEVVITNYNDFAVHKLNERNLIHSGAEWYGEVFSDQTPLNLFFDLPTRDVFSPVHISGEFVAKSTKTSNFFVKVNGAEILQRPITAVPSNSLTKYANAGSRSIWFHSNVVPSLNVTITYDKPEPNAIGWLNYIELNYMSLLRYNGESFRFRNHGSAGPGKISEFIISNSTNDLSVWNINNPLNPKTIELSQLNGNANFILATDLVLEFIGFDEANFKTPEPIGEVPNQNLHAIASAEFIIVSHPDFIDQAERLKLLHEEMDGMDVVVVNVDEIYNEFSSGSPDPSAIRDFVRMIYLRSGNPPALKYLMLFGDGSYDPKNRIPDNRNFIIAYQSKQSIWPTATYVTDDFYGMMDPNEGTDANGNVDIGIGRLPANTKQEAKMMVDKIESYMRYRPETQGHWRNTFTFVADDEDFNLHFYQADTILISLIRRNNQNVNINKIYLDAYPQQTTASGQFYPDVNNAINKQINEGTLIVNYTGHGGEFGLAGEKIMQVSDILSWDNSPALPVFITATCEFSPFDNPALTSAGEMVLLNPRGGGVALFSTTRRAFASSNLLLNRRLYDTLFRAYPNSHPRLGDLMMFSKNPANSNIRNFVLLGNPALKLALPYHNVVTDSINGMPVHLFSDTLTSSGLVTVSGHIEHYQNRGAVFNAFNGLIYPVMYDKPETITTLGNDSKSYPVDFEVQNSILYKGVASVVNGRFSFTFMLPKDISFTYGNGKLSYYAAAVQTDATGYYSDFIIGGVGSGNNADSSGPEIELFLNDSTFVSFSEINNQPIMYARLSDPSGINWMGNAIGRDITLTLNGQSRNAIILNDFFEPDVDDFRSGSVTYPLKKLLPGDYTLELRAWDMMNNTSTKSVFFKVSDSINLDVMQVYNYPNPFSDHTWFTFRHNQFEGELDVKIEIYNFHGQMVRTIGPQKVITSGYSLEPIFWDRTTQGGAKLDSGVYFYKMQVENKIGQSSQRTQKMILTR